MVVVVSDGLCRVESIQSPIIKTDFSIAAFVAIYRE